MICMSPDLPSLNFAAKRLAQSGQSNLVSYLKISALSFSLKVCQQLQKKTQFLMYFSGYFLQENSLPQRFEL